MDENNEVTKVKCKPGQGKLNRLIAKAQKTLTSLGHTKRSFKRLYDIGTASYTCPVCGAIGYVDIHAPVLKIRGTAVNDKCKTATGEQNAEN